MWASGSHAHGDLKVRACGSPGGWCQQGMGKSGASHPSRQNEPVDLPTCAFRGLIREKVRRCVGGMTTEGICWQAKNDF